MWHYWYLTPKGIEYLREYLHAEADVVPATMKPRAVSGVRGERDGRPERRGPRRFGDETGDKKVGGAPGGYRPEFRDRSGAPRSGDRFGARGPARNAAPRSE